MIVAMAFGLGMVVGILMLAVLMAFTEEEIDYD